MDDRQHQTEEQCCYNSQLSAIILDLKQLHRLSTSNYNIFEDLLSDYLQTGCNILKSSTGIISQIKDQTYIVSAVESNLEFLKPNLTFNLEDTYCIEVVRNKQMIAYPQIGEIASIQGSSFYHKLKLKSYIGTPIFVNGEIYGTLNFASTQVRHQNFTDREQEFIAMMAESLGKAIATYQTEIKHQQVELSLRESEGRLRTIFHNTFQFIGLLTPDGAIVEINQALKDFTNIQHDDAVGVMFWESKGWKISEKQQHQLKKAIATAASGKFVRYEVDIKNIEDIVTTLDFSLKPVFDDTGNVTSLILEGCDITERKQSEKRLRLLERAIAASSNGIIISNPRQPDNPTVYVNSGFERMTGYSAREVVGKNCRFLQGTDTNQAVLEELRKAIAEGREGQFILRNYRKDGTLFWNEFSITPVRDVNGNLTNFIGIQTDVSDRKQADIELATAKAALEQQIQRTLLFNQITQEIRSSLDPKQIFQTAATQIGKALGANRCLIHSYERLIPQIPFVAEYKDPGLASILNVEIPVEGNPHLELLLTKDTAIASDNVYTDPLLEPAKPLCYQLGMKSMLAVRTSYQGKTNGVIGIHQNDRFRHWKADEIELLESVAAQVGIAIAQANLLQQETQRRQELAGQNQQLQAEIQGRRQIEEALRQSEERWQLALRGNNDGIWDHNLKNNQHFLSTRCGEMLGYINGELPSFDEWIKLVHTDDLEAMISAFQKHINHQTPHYVAEYRMRCKDGTYKWILSRGQALWDESGNPVRMVGSLTDISDRKQVEERLRASQQRLSFLVQNVPLAVIEWNPNGKIVTWNQAAEQIFGYSATEVNGKHQYEILVPENAKVQVSQIFQQLLNQQGGNYSINENITKAGKRIICEWYNTSLLDEQGSVLGMASIALDITERQQAEIALKQAKEAAEKANRAKSNFLASMSHELRTPLNAILGFSQILSQDESLTTQHREHLGIINRSGEHLLELINDVLSMSKIEAGRIILNESCFDLHWLLQSVEEMLQFKANAKGLQLRCEYHSNIPRYVQTDESKLRQVLINLLGNAIKFTQQGSVTLRVGLGEGERGRGGEKNANVPFPIPNSQFPIPNSQFSITFEVEDTGQGIAAEEINTLFDPFVQTQTGLHSMEGTGLGLPISREFTRLMGGDIAVKSILGKGSTFTFDIKVSETSATNVEIKFPQRKIIGLEPNQPNYRILIVEDVKENRQLLVNILETLGFEIREAVNGQEAVTLWQSWQPHLIWMDIKMPVMDGYEATRAIKQMPGGKDTVIIALTASAFEEQRETVLKAGCDDFVSKPFQQELLLEKMALYLEVRYIYGQEQPKSSSLTRIKPLTPEALAVMPLKWLAQLHLSAESCQDDKILILIEQIPESHADLKLALADLVDNFRLDIIISLTQSFI